MCKGEARATEDYTLMHRILHADSCRNKLRNQLEKHKADGFRAANVSHGSCASR